MKVLGLLCPALELGQLTSSPRVSYNSSLAVAPFDMREVKWYNQSDFEILRYLDEGRFSTVFSAESSKSTERVVLKVLHPTYHGKIKREIRMLHACRDFKYVVQLLGVIKCRGLRTVALVLESLGDEVQYLGHQGKSLDGEEIKYYMRCLLTGLKECHQAGIMHRDIKNRNIMVNKVTKQLRIIDLGLSEVYIPNKQYNPSVCSKSYKAPELLLNYLYYDFAIDIWAAGCVFAGLLFKKEPFFVGTDKTEVLRNIASVVGSFPFRSWTQKYNIRLNTAVNRAIGDRPQVPWRELVTSDISGLCTDEALDLLSHMLVVDHRSRFTAEECLLHPFFVH